MLSLISCKDKGQQAAPKAAQPPLQMQPAQPMPVPPHGGTGISKVRSMWLFLRA